MGNQKTQLPQPPLTRARLFPSDHHSSFIPREAINSSFAFSLILVEPAPCFPFRDTRTTSWHPLPKRLSALQTVLRTSKFEKSQTFLCSSGPKETLLTASCACDPGTRQLSLFVFSILQYLINNSSYWILSGKVTGVFSVSWMDPD